MGVFTDIMKIEDFSSAKVKARMDLKKQAAKHLDEMVEAADSYFGKDLNVESNEKLNKLREYSKAISERVPDIKFKCIPLTNESRYGMVQLSTDLMGFMTPDKRAVSMLALMYQLADIVNMNVAVEGGDEILITFFVDNMWNERGTK
jgi:hypothetical protein